MLKTYVHDINFPLTPVLFVSRIISKTGVNCYPLMSLLLTKSSLIKMEIKLDTYLKTL